MAVLWHSSYYLRCHNLYGLEFLMEVVKQTIWSAIVKIKFSSDTRMDQLFSRFLNQILTNLPNVPHVMPDRYACRVDLLIRVHDTDSPVTLVVDFSQSWLWWIESHMRELLFKVPQGSVLELVLFITYTSPLGKWLWSLGIKYHFYTNDTKLYVTLNIDDADVATGGWWVPLYKNV